MTDDQPETITEYKLVHEIQKRSWQLLIKSVFKMAILLLIIFNFTYIYPMISVIILFIAYFSMPTSYSTDQVWKSLEAWMRIFIGLCIAALLWSILTFGGSASGFMSGLFILPVLFSGGSAMSIYFLTLAFFLTLPERKEVDDGIAGMFSKNKYANGVRTLVTEKGTNASGLGNAMFLLLTLFSGLNIILTWLEGSEQFQLIFLIFWIMFLVAGWTGGRQGRPYIGIMMVGLALFAFSFAYTGIVGDAVFGQYWPTVEHYGSMITEPISASFTQASTGMEDAWLLMTCPTCYYQQQLEEQQGLQPDVAAGGNVKALEVKEFRATNIASGDEKIDPDSPFIGTLIIENKGEISADRVTVTLDRPLRKDPLKIGAKYNSSVDCHIFEGILGVQEGTCTYVPLDADSCVFTSCLGSTTPSLFDGDPTSCEWNTDPMTPGELKVMNFRCGKTGDFTSWSTSGINYCKCVNMNDICNEVSADSEEITCDAGYSCELGLCTKTASCNGGCGTGDTIGYLYADQYLTIRANYSFEYNVTMQTEINIMDSATYQTKLLNKEINPEPVESKYSGGPVTLGIWLQDQPLRSGELSYATISVYNDGKGVLKTTPEKAKLIVRIPAEFIQLAEHTVEGRFGRSNIAVEDSNVISVKRASTPVIEKYQDENGVWYYEITADVDELALDEFARITFTFTGAIGNALEKTSILTGSLDYNYELSQDREYPLIKAPIQ